MHLLGKILKDEDKLETYNIQTGESLHLVIRKKPSDAPRPEQPVSSANPTSEAMGTGGLGSGGIGAMEGFGMGFPGAGMAGMPGMAGMGMPGLGMMNEDMLSNFMQGVSYK